MDEQVNTGPKLDVSVKVYPTKESGPLLAFASVNLGGCFAVNGIRIMDTKKGTFIAMPGRKDKEGKYARTREVYAAYKKSRHKKEFRAEHAEELAQHEAAKQAFDALGGKPIPKVAQLSKEYAALLAEKRAEYENYKTLRQEMITIRTAKQNVDRILGPEQETVRSTEMNR